MEKKDGTTSEGVTRGLRRSPSADQRQAKSRGASWFEEGGGELWPVSERISREAGPWASIAFFAIGGILGQLIQELERQLAEQDDCIESYQAKIKQNQEDILWHERKKADVAQRLAHLKANAASLQASLTGEAGE
jgi:uncharacterized coiled-coil protein SlyX